MTDRLYGLPHAETMHDDPISVWECEIDGHYEDGDGPWTIEEWTVRPPISTVRSADLIVDDILEWMADEDEGLGGNGDRIAKDSTVLAAAETLRWAIARQITWRWADKLVATRTIALGVNGEPLLDGEPMWQPTTENKQ